MPSAWRATSRRPGETAPPSRKGLLFCRSKKRSSRKSASSWSKGWRRNTWTNRKNRVSGAGFNKSIPSTCSRRASAISKNQLSCLTKRFRPLKKSPRKNPMPVNPPSLLSSRDRWKYKTSKIQPKKTEAKTNQSRLPNKRASESPFWSATRNMNTRRLQVKKRWEVQGNLKRTSNLWLKIRGFQIWIKCVPVFFFKTSKRLSQKTSRWPNRTKNH